MYPGMPKVLKTTGLQYLCNILRKKVSDKADFLPADKYENFL